MVYRVKKFDTNEQIYAFVHSYLKHITTVNIRLLGFLVMTFRPHRICIAYRCGLLLLACRHVCVSVRVSVTNGILQKWLDRSRCRLARGLGWAQGTVYYMGAQISSGEGEILRVGIHGHDWACSPSSFCNIRHSHVSRAVVSI